MGTLAYVPWCMGIAVHLGLLVLGWGAEGTGRHFWVSCWVKARLAANQPSVQDGLPAPALSYPKGLAGPLLVPAESPSGADSSVNALQTLLS